MVHDPRSNYNQSAQVGRTRKVWSERGRVTHDVVYERAIMTPIAYLDLLFLFVALEEKSSCHGHIQGSFRLCCTSFVF